MKGCEQISFLFLLLIFPFVLCYPQEQQYKFEHISTKHGLSSNEINCIYRDSRGFFWFGTTRGLNRFDGYDFKIYKNISDDPYSLSSDTILCIIEDNMRDLLIGTYSGGLNRFNIATEEFTQYIHKPENENSISHNRVNEINIDNDGSIWIGTHFGLNLYNSDTKSFSGFKISPEDIDRKSNQINTIFQDMAGNFWIGTNNGLYRFDEKSKHYESYELRLPNEIATNRHKIITSINEDQSGAIWIGTSYWIFKIIDDSISWIGPNEVISMYTSNASIKDIQVFDWQNERHLWIATGWGLNRYDFVKNEFVRIYSQPDWPESLSSNSIQKLYFDNHGILWIGTHDQGINYLNLTKNIFVQHDILGNNFHHSACTFYENPIGNMWIGSHAGGLLKYDSALNLIKRFKFKNQKSIERLNYRVKTIVEDAQKNIWVGIHSSFPGVYVFDEDKELFLSIPYDTTSGCAAPSFVFDLIIDSDNRKWLGTSSGLYLIDGDFSDTMQDYCVEHTILSHAYIHDLCLDKSGKIWVASNEGLFSFYPDRFDSLVFEKYKHSSDTQNVIPKYILEAEDGTIWIATNKNLCKLSIENNTYKSVEINNELINDNKIVSIVEDNNGLLWMNTWKGIVRYDPGKKSGPSTKLFDVSDGLPYDGYIETPMFISRKGKIFIPAQHGTQNGFISFHPDSIKDNPLIPPVVITDFEIRNKRIKLDSSISVKKEIILRHDENFFSFEFASLNFINPEKNQYAYYLEGLEDDWIYTGNRRNANYTGVPPGNYIFRVKGSNNDGFWNETGTSISVKILPPHWKTWWAYILYGVVLGALLYTIRRYDLKRQHLKQELEIEHVEAEKLKELDSMKSRFFANISHEFRTPLTLILGPIEKLRSYINDREPKKDLDMMQRNAHRLQRLINQLLNLSQIESGKMKLQVREENIVSLVNGYVQSFESLAKQKKIDLNFKSAEENIPLFVDKDKVEKILYNLLSNAFKFTGEGGRIEVAVTPLPPSMGDIQPTKTILQNDAKSPPSRGDGRGVRISISDTGNGIPPEKLEHIFDRFYQADDSYTKDQEGTGIGLALTKELVEIHHGKITIESEVEKGSTFFVFLPKGKEHLKAEEISESVKMVKIVESVEIVEQFTESNTKDGIIDDDGIEDSKPLLLIVDDNADLRTYMRGYLDMYYYISEAREGEEGFNKATEKIPDLIISDVMMPKMDGYELCEKLKTDERTSHIPVILLTARASMESRIEGLETGADDFITKPFDHQELLIRIKNLIQQRNKLKDKYRIEIDYNKLSKDRNILSMDQQFIRKAKLVVENNISEPDLNAENFAREMALSRVQLHRKLKALVDQSATQFVRTIRLNRAAELLTKHSGTVSEIAYDVGFNTLPYFTKCFQEQFGVNPSEFNNQDRKS